MWGAEGMKLEKKRKRKEERILMSRYFVKNEILKNIEKRNTRFSSFLL